MAQKQMVKKIGLLPIERITPVMMQRTRLKAMKVVGNASKNHFIKGFSQGGKQTDESKTGWQRRKVETSKTRGRGILVGLGGGHLWRDITVLSVTGDTIIIGTSRIQYAARHNQGLDGMPQREFIGPSGELEEVNGDIIIEIMGKPLEPHL